MSSDGAGARSGSEARGSAPGGSADDPVVVARFHYRHQAELAHGYLRDAGIESALFIDDAGGMEVGLAFANPARLLVRPRDLAEAHDVLEGAGMVESGDG